MPADQLHVMLYMYLQKCIHTYMVAKLFFDSLLQACLSGMSNSLLMQHTHYTGNHITEDIQGTAYSLILSSPWPWHPFLLSWLYWDSCLLQWLWRELDDTFWTYMIQ